MTEKQLNQPVWEIESSKPDLVEQLKNALKEVFDPEIRLNIIQLGLVRNIQINDGALVITMIMTTPFCPYAPALIEMTQQKASSVVDMPVVMALGMEAWDFSMMEDPSGFEWGMYS
jgi:metal-sulfur cluster biosynthetic enzyme